MTSGLLSLALAAGEGTQKSARAAIDLLRNACDGEADRGRA